MHLGKITERSVRENRNHLDVSIIGRECNLSNVCSPNNGEAESPIDVLPASIDVGEIPVTTHSAFEETEIAQMAGGGSDLGGFHRKFYIGGHVCLVP